VAGGARLTVENAGNVIGDTATVALSSSGSYATMYLTNSVNDTVGYLYFDGDPQLSGTWGATGSGCANTNDNFFLGAGKLTVANGPAANNGSWGVDNGGNWSTPGNWRNSIIAFGAGNTAYFTNTVTVSRTVTNNYQTVTIDSMSFGSPGAFNWTVVGNTISMNGTVTVSANAAAINSILGGAGALAKAGAGTLTLAGTNTLTGGVTLNAGTLNINNATALGTVAGTFTIGGVTTIDSSAADVAMTANNPQAWNADFTFTGSYNLDMGTGSVTLGASRQVTASAKKLTVGGAISGAGLTITKAGNGTLALNGNITTTTGAITVSAGTLTLAGANTFTGGVTNNASCTVNINSASALGGATSTFMILGGTIDSSVADVAMTANNPQSWNGDFTFTGNYNLNLGTGAVTMNAGRQVTVSAKTLTVGGAIGGGAYTLTKLGTGTLVLAGTAANTYSGTTTVNYGELDLNKTAGVNAIAAGLVIGDGTGGANADIVKLLASNQIADTSAVTINSSGKFDMNNNSETIASFADAGAGVGNINLGSGTLTFGDATASLTFSGVIAGSGAVTKQGSGTMILSGANTYNGATAVNCGTLTLNGINTGATTITVGGNGTTGTPTLTGTGTAGGAVTISGPGTGVAGTISSSNGSTLTISGVLTLSSGSLSSFSLSGASTATPEIDASAGGISSSAACNTITFTGTPTSGQQYNLFKYKAGGDPGTTAFSINTGASPSGFSYTLYDDTVNHYIYVIPNILPKYWDTNGATTGCGNAGGTWDTGTTANWCSQADGAAASGMWVAGCDAVFSAGTDGTGSLTISGSGVNSVRNLTVEEGTISLSTGTGSFTLAAGATWNVSAGNSLTVGRNIDNGGNLFTVTNALSATLTFNCGISGAGGLTKNGSGTVSLGGQINSYGGTTTVNAGTLQVGINGQNFGAVVVGGVGAGVTATFDLNSHDANVSSLTLGGSTTTSGASVTMPGTGGIHFSGDITYDATHNPLGATITPGGGSKLSMNATRTLTIGDSSSTPDDLTISAPIDNTGGITKAGAGTLTLSAQNNFTTVVTINAGTVKLGIDGQDTGHSPLGTAGASVTATGAALDVNGTSAVNLPVTLNGTGVSSCGALMNSSITLGTYAGLITLGSASSIDAWNGDLNVNNGGTITGSGFGLTLDGVGTSTSSSLASIIGTGAGTLTKNGAGTWTISVNNSYTGVTTISGGTLIVNNFANGGAVSGIGASTAAAANLVLDGGTLKFAASGYATSDRAFTITANGGAIDASGPGGTLSLNGTTDLAASGTGNRTLTLTGNNVDFNDLIPKIVDPSSGSTCLAKSGVGKWRLSNTTANTFTGSTTVNAGTLYLDYNSAALNKQKIATGAALILGGGTLYLNDYNAGTTATLGNGLQLNAGGSTITLAGLNGGSSFALSGITRSTAGTLNYSKLASGNITTTKVNSNGIIGGYFVVNNNDWAVGSDSGSASNVTALATYTVLPASGASSTVNYQSLGSGNTITLTASETGNSLQIVSQSRVTVNSPYTLTLTSGGIIMVGGDQQNIDGTGIVGPPSGTGELFVWATGPGNYGISCRIIGDGTSGSLVKDGPNTLGLGFANNYTGGTFINNGALMQNVANAVPTNSLITANGMYNLGTYNATINGLCGSGTVNHGAASVTLTICGTGQNNTFNGRILENGFPYFLTLVMTGTGTQTLGGVNGYTSSTTINGGTLNITGSLASGSAVTVGGASASGTPTLAGNGWIYGSTTVNSSGGGAAGHIAPGNAGAGRLSTASLTLNPTVNLEFDLDQPNLPFGAGTNDYIVVTNGGSANLTISTNLTFTITGGPSVGSGKYHLIKYNGTLTDNSSGFTAWTIAPPSYSGTFSSDTVNKYIDLTLSFSAPYGPTISNDGGPSNVTSTAAWLIASLTSTGNAPTTVYVFWDTADQGTNQTAWAFTNSYGVLATGVYSNNATSLITDTPYYYRSYATNSAGQCWATATTFTPRLLPPTINNDGGASNIAGSAATLNGNLTSTGGAPTTVYIFWGSSDGGTTMANWGHTNSLGSKGTGFLSSDISGLAGSTTYYYRFYATNSAGQCWASPSSSFTTPWNGSGFGNKLKITFSGYNKTDTLTNFPALVVLSTNITNFSYIEFGSTNGWDLTFQNSNETVLLNYEIEKWDPSTISSPTDIPGCQLWLRADQGVLTNTSGVVTNWQDQSGRGVVLTNSGSPAVITNLYNGQPAVRFYGTNDWFSDVNLGSSNNYFHSFCVLKAKSGSTSTFLYALHSSTLYAAKLWVNGSSKYEIGYHTGYYVQSDNAVGNLDLVQSSYGGNTLLQYVNGEQQSGSFSSGDSDTTYGGAYTMFNEYNGVSTGYLAFAGDVAEMIVYSNTLSAAQQSWIGGYLAKKYGLSTSYGSYPGQSYVWAQVPSFYSNCWIWAYWSNASYSVTSAPAAYTTNGATWDSNFGGVWHMSEAAGHNGTQRDSTSNNNTMTLLDNSGVSTGGISSVVDGGDYIYGQSGDGRRLQVDASASIRNSTNLTVSMWTKHVQSTWWSAGTVLMTKRGEYEMYAVNAHDVAFRFWSGGFQKSTDNYTVPDIAGWHYYVGTYSKNSQWEVLFFDGQQVVSNSYNFTIDSGNEIAWGYAMPLGPSQYRGWFDESRFEPIARGSNWIWACYMTMASNTPVFTTYGTVQFLSVTNAPIIDNDSGPSNVTSSTAWLIANLISTGSVPTTVRTYWDTTDRGENLTAWAYTNNTFGQVPVGVYSNQAASLTTNTTYYYRSYATNSAGQCWAGATSFTTWGPPTITYDGGASNVSSTFAWLNANLLGTGGVPTTVRIFWDTASDKGTSQTAWAYTNDFGVLPVGLCSNQASGLSASTLYYYRAYATNSVGQSWSDVTNFTTLSPNATGWLIEIE
jgi:autotransporter-associated beta strand protein